MTYDDIDDLYWSTTEALRDGRADRDADGWWMTVRAKCPRCRRRWIAVMPAILTRFSCHHCERRGRTTWLRVGAPDLSSLDDTASPAVPSRQSAVTNLLDAYLAIVLTLGLAAAPTRSVTASPVAPIPGSRDHPPS